MDIFVRFCDIFVRFSLKIEGFKVKLLFKNRTKISKGRSL